MSKADIQQPVAWIERGLIEAPDALVWERGPVGDYTPLYTAPPQRQPLTDVEIRQICHANGWDDSYQSMRFARTVIAAYEHKQGERRE